MMLLTVHFVIAVLLAETAWLAWARPALLRELAPHLLAGAGLVLALRSTLVGAIAPATLAWLLLAGLAHGAAVWRSLRRSR